METFDVPSADDERLLFGLLTPLMGVAGARDATGALFARFGTLAAILAAPPSETVRVLGEDRTDCAEHLNHLQHLVLSVLHQKIIARRILPSSSAVRAYLRTDLAHEPREQFRILHLDARHHLIRDERMWSGTIDHAPVYPREVARRALELGSRRLILVHNHPSGDPRPSYADIRMTEAIVRACAALDLEVLDHLVIGREGLTSFRDQALGPWAKPLPGARGNAALRRVASA